MFILRKIEDRETSIIGRPGRRIIPLSLALGCLGSPLAISTSALAEEAGAKQEGKGWMEEIIVTARKREESFVDVPSSLSVIGGEQLDAYATQQLADLADSVPNLSVAQTNGAKRMSIRGFGSVSVSNFFDQAVGLAVDGLTLQRTQTWELGYFDVERVEVLRGPQGSYFGRNTTAGLVNITSRGPSEEFESSVTTAYETETDEFRYGVSLSGPMSETLGARLAVQRRESDGWMKSTPSPFWHSDTPGIEETLARLTFEWEASDHVTVTSKTSFSDFELSGIDTQVVYCGPVTQGTLQFAQLLGFTRNIDDCTADDRKSGEAGVVGGINGEGPHFRTFEGWMQTLNIEWELGEYTLTSVTGYQQFDSFAFFPALYLEMRGTSALTESDWEDFSQELRLTSPSFDWGDFVIGAFYNSSDVTMDQGVDIDMNVLTLGFGIPGIGPFGPSNGSSSFKSLEQDQESYALFGEVNIDLAKDWELTLGGRYTRDEKDVRFVHTTGPLGVADNPASVEAFLAGPVFGFVPFDLEADDSYTDFSPSATLKWQFSDQGSVYFSYKEGFKSGGFDQATALPGPGGPNDLPVGFSFDSEEVEAIELGIKLELPDQGMLISGAIFHQEFTDLQVQSSIPDQIVNTSLITTNAADSTSQGAELEMLWLPTENLRINASLAYLDAEYDSYPDAQCYNEQTVEQGCRMVSATISRQDLSGERLVFAPEYHAAAGFVYNVPLGSGMEFEIGGDLNYRSEMELLTTLAPGSASDKLTMVNATVALKSADDGWELRLIGRNLLDEDVLNYYAAGIPFPDAAIASIIPPRRLMVQLTYNF